MKKQETMPALSCPQCGGRELYSRRIAANDACSLALLPGLGSLMHYAEWDVVVCSHCGLVRFFAEPAARENVRSHPDWKRLT